MFAHHNIVYRRGQHGRRHHAARDSVDSPSAALSSPKSSDAATPPTLESVSATAQTSAASSSPASSSTPAASTSAPTSASASTSTLASSSSSSSSARSSAASSSSASSATPSAASTPLVNSTPVLSHGVVITSHVAGQSYTPISTLAPSASTTASPDSSSGVNTGLIIGIVAGTLAGLAVLGFLFTWCIRRQRDRDVDDFDADAFKRQSAMLVDDPVGPPHSYNPRPPTMIESHNVSPALAAQSGYGGQNFYGSYGEYAQEPGYPPEMAQLSGSPPQQVYATPPVGYPNYNPAQQLGRQPSSAGYLTRQQSSAAGYAPPPVPPSTRDPNARYIDLNRSSVSPYQAAQYADISRQLGTFNPNNGQVSQELPDDPLPSPFDDPPQARPVPDAVSGPVTMAHTTQSPGGFPAPDQLPAAAYEARDAYGGI